MQSGRDEASIDSTDEEEGLSLARFVREVTLPHRAKVREGYYEEGDADGDREFSNGDVIEVRRIICPLVILSYEDPVTREVVRVSATTRNPDVRFHVLTRKEMVRTAKQRHFRSVQEVVDSWPHVIKCLSEQTVVCVGFDERDYSESVTIQKDDELRLIRMIYDGHGGSFLECRVQRTTQLVWFQSNSEGSFVEVPDRMSYTLRELVDIAWVERNLRVDYNSMGDEQPSLPNGIPSDYTGVIAMEKPEVLIEICRFLNDEDSERCVLSTPLLVPIDCDIRISSRQDEYTPIPKVPRKLAELLSTATKNVLPAVAQISGWTEQSGILVNHVTRPGDHVMLYSITAIDRVLAHCHDRYFLIPTSHSGRFLRLHGNNGEPTEIQLGLLATEAFPFDVEYHDDDTYTNTRDDLPSSTVLTFSAFIEADPCVVVSKLFGDVIGEGFHLPLATNIVVQLEKRVKNGAKVPSRISLFDHCSEEISESTFKKLVKSSRCKHAPQSSGDGTTTSNASSDLATPPIVPQRVRNPSTTYEDTIHPVGRTFRPPPPIPDSRTENEYEYDDDDHAYCYIDVAELEAARKKFASESTNYATIVIPSNGNISQFTVDEMLSFLKENSIPGNIISSWKKNGYNGRSFAMMSDDELASHGLATPVIQFFRDRSKMQIVLNLL